MFDHRRLGRRRFAALTTVLAALLAVTTTTITGSTATAATHHRDGRLLPYRDAHLATSARVADLLGRMTLEEKVGQMTQAERGDVAADPTLVATWGLGSVLSGGGSVPADNTPAGWADMVDTFQRAALGTRLGIPILYGVDSVHGHGNLNGATLFPHNIGLGATRDPKLVGKIGAITAEETRASGPQWAFAPCICVARDDRWGRTYESFGESPALVASMETIIDGLQGAPGELAEPDHVLATAKHFAGDGLTSYDDSLAGTGAYPIDQGIDKVDRPTFDRLALAPYWPAVQQHHVGSVMPSFSSVDWTEDGLGNPVKMHANHELITDVLKGAIGFDGIVISDWQGIRQIPGDYATQVATAVNAGIDMFMEPYSGSATGAPDFIATLVGLVQDHTVAMSRIDDAVTRILTAKFELGLFEHPFTDRSNLDDIGSPAHRAVARRAVQESQVLLRNAGRTLPLGGRHPVYVAGSNADNLGNQAGGWTLTWQGGSTNVFPGQTILDGIRHQARDVTFSEDASAPVPAGADGIVVVGETPYAEGFGDVGGPQWAYDPGDHGVPRPPKTMELSDADKAAVAKVCAAAASCTVVVVSGRPIVIDPALLPQIDALVASWLPGSEGEGVADVLFGDADFTGKLPVTWPRSVAQEPINVGDASYDPLYPYGWGLRTGHGRG
jgi:beta-glucosidase